MPRKYGRTRVKGECYMCQLQAEGFIPDTLTRSVETGNREYVEIDTPHPTATG